VRLAESHQPSLFDTYSLIPQQHTQSDLQTLHQSLVLLKRHSTFLIPRPLNRLKQILKTHLNQLVDFCQGLLGVGPRGLQVAVDVEQEVVEEVDDVLGVGDCGRGQ